LQAARQNQATETFKTQYAARAGIEGTLGQGVSRGGLRRTRYRGLLKTRLQHIFMAVAINLIRVLAWLNDLPLAETRRSAFAALALPG
jgi:transposase